MDQASVHWKVYLYWNLGCMTEAAAGFDIRPTLQTSSETFYIMSFYEAHRHRKVAKLYIHLKPTLYRGVYPYIGPTDGATAPWAIWGWGN